MPFPKGTSFRKISTPVMSVKIQIVMMPSIRQLMIKVDLRLYGLILKFTTLTKLVKLVIKMTMLEMKKF